jgi:hypothetical protein
MALEQLLYTWAERGLEGRGRLQAVAVTEGLRVEGTAARRLAQRLCRYDRPPGASARDELPRSYGWVDSGGNRFAFSRKPLGLDAMGRPGNFAAHVLVGSVAELPAARLVALFDSTSWWDGDLTSAAVASGTLPTTGLDSFAPGRPAELDVELAELVLATLLGPPAKRHSFALSPADLVRSLGGALEIVPGLLESSSFSSYESGAAAEWFDVIGVGSGPTGGRAHTRSSMSASGPATPERRAARLVLAADPATRDVVRRCWQAAPDSGGGGRRHFALVCAALQSAGSGEPLSAEDVLPGLTHHLTACDLLDHLAVRACLAEGLVRGQQAVEQALFHVVAALDPEVLASLGEEAADRADPGRPDQLERVTRRLAGLSVVSLDSFAARLSARAVEAPQQVASWPPQLLAAAMRGSDAFDRNPQLRKALLDGAVGHLMVLVSGAAAPATFLAEALQVGVSSRRVGLGEAARALRASPDLTRLAWPRLGPTTFTALLGELDPADAERVLRAAGRPSDVEALLPSIAAVVGRFAPHRRFALLHDLRLDVVGRSQAAVWAALVEDAVVARVRHDLTEYRIRHVNDRLLDLTRYSQDLKVSRWREVLLQLVGGGHERRRPFRSNQLPEGFERIAARYALDVLASRSFTRLQVQNVVGSLHHCLGLDDVGLIRALLRAGLRGTTVDLRPDAGVAVLSYINDVLVVQKRVERTMVTGRLADETSHELAATLMEAIARCGPDWRNAAQDVVVTGFGLRAWV